MGALPALPILYSFRRCPYAMRARLALSVSGQAHELREVVLRNKPADLLAASPKGTVPVLVLPGGEVLGESLDIMRWALARHDPAQWLSPPGASSGEMEALIAANDGDFKRHLDRYKYPNRYAGESGGEAAGFALTHRTKAAQWLAQLDARLDDGWLLGTQASLADMAILPFVRQFAHTDADWFAAQPWPRLQGWLAAFEVSDLYAGVMGKHATWQPAAEGQV
ncbi:MAG: glutathione S-transferase [Polaromonas sp.]|uniref:glutathione S-transferase n=1 Tax=Polaromonas sp. TaxID=1869339 RepID=UPI002717EDC1|nr:glutathione S-transferase [Polaromonas sp.]MDO9114104.1 glutathione S-transferase [Polaromonas sp.]MDP1885838.1 glutathione S-transferase [Polaromonas sp.]